MKVRLSVKQTLSNGKVEDREILSFVSGENHFPLPDLMSFINHWIDSESTIADDFKFELFVDLCD